MRPSIVVVGALNDTAPKYIIMILGRYFMCFQKCIPVRCMS